MQTFASRVGLRLLSGLCLAILLAACAGAPRAPEQPVQSPNDRYQYRFLTLDNQMRVLLISDPATPKAAAALAVMVGSGDNPEGRAGLAHFLEHMLFLGTDKYPDAAEYERFITEHGGTRNAYTSFEETNYFFDINPPFLPEALDRFAQFFIAPRFDAQYVERERNAVEAEYQMGLKSDTRRGLDVYQEVMNPAHPYKQFAVGSLESLADRPDAPVRQDLLAFYDRYYSANIMRLAVLGAQPLDELEALVRQSFSQVPNKAVQLETIAAPLFTPGELPMFVQVKPLATLQQLEVSFPIADYRSAYRAKPAAYVGNLVGHEGEGSLLSALKSEGLAEALRAGAGLDWRGGGLFSITITLTEKGVAGHQRVLQLLFAYLDMLRAAGPREHLYDEQARIADLGFRFREHGSPINYVTALATGMEVFAPQDLLQGPYLMADYDPAMLTELVDRLRPGNAMVVLSDASATTDRESAYYRVPYARGALPLAGTSAPASDPAVATLQLPAANDFIAEDVTLVDLPGDRPAVPVISRETARERVWFMQDDEFRVPRGAMFLEFRSSELGQSAEQAALASLYADLLTDSVNEFAYPAALAGLYFGIQRQGASLVLAVEGYNDKQALLLKRLLAAVREPDFDPRRFGDIRANMIRALRNSSAKAASSQIIDDLREATDYAEWGEQARIEALERTDLPALEAYAARFWQSASVEVLVYGNFAPSAVDAVTELVGTVLPDGAAPAVPARRILALGAGESLQYAAQIAHDDAVIAWYLQGANRSWADQAATALTAQIIKSGFFQELRTEQQLGYAVSSFYWQQRRVPGLVLLIQSPVADTAALVDAIEAFLAGVEPQLDAAQFERHKAALVSDILRPHRNLNERADYYWSAIRDREPQFDSREQLAAAVEALTLSDWQDYFRHVFMSERHSLQVVAPGARETLPAATQRFHDAQTLKAGHAVYTID